MSILIDEFDMHEEISRTTSSNSTLLMRSANLIRTSLENINSKIFDNIEAVLKCDKNDVSDVYPLSQGLTNLSCHFRVGEEEYVYRHPGVGTEELIDRHAESVAQRAAAQLGLDDTYIHEDENEGWKIARFITNSRALDPHDPEQLETAMKMARQLHEQDIEVERSFDFYDESLRYEELLGGPQAVEAIPGYKARAEKFARLKAYVEQDNAPVCLTHNDFLGKRDFPRSKRTIVTT